jgi:membrane-bound metal-dependent hydrolase YbcI (DUF457 family)
MNKQGHFFTGVSFFALYQKGYFFLPVPLNHYALQLNFNNIIPISLLLGVTIIGALLPDIDLKFKHFYNDPKGNKRYLYHRQITHSLFLWVGLFIYAAYNYNVYLFYFALGGISHLFGDMITGSVPIFLWGKYYNSFTRIGVDRIYSNPRLYSKFAKKLDSIMIFVAGFSVAYFIF